MSRNKNKETFVTISNSQIYKELCDLKTNNEKAHDEIVKKLDANYNTLLLQVSKYQAQVTNLKAVIGGVGALSMAILGWFIYHINK